MNNVHFSSAKSDWGTPLYFFQRLDEIYNFTLDPCANNLNAKCKNYFDRDGLKKDWSNNSVFVNPPYGRNIGNWVKKGYEEGLKENTMVVMLLPCRTDTRWWHDYCMKAEKVFFVKGRLIFDGAVNSAPFPSCVVVFNGENNNIAFLTMEK